MKNEENGSIDFLVEKKDLKMLNISEKDISSFILEGKETPHLSQVFNDLINKMANKAMEVLGEVNGFAGFEIKVQLLDSNELMFYFYTIENDEFESDIEDLDCLDDNILDYIMEDYSYDNTSIPKYILFSKFDDLRFLSDIDIHCSRSILYKSNNEYVLELRGCSLDYSTFLSLIDIAEFVDKPHECKVMIEIHALENLKLYFEANSCE